MLSMKPCLLKFVSQIAVRTLMWGESGLGLWHGVYRILRWETLPHHRPNQDSPSPTPWLLFTLGGNWPQALLHINVFLPHLSDCHNDRNCVSYLQTRICLFHTLFLSFSNTLDVYFKHSHMQKIAQELHKRTFSGYSRFLEGGCHKIMFSCSHSPQLVQPGNIVNVIS